MENKDKIIIKGLELFGHHGVLSEENELGQKFILDITMFLDVSEAAREDNVQKTINYASLSKELALEFKKEKYNLIETATEKLCHYILTNYPLVQEVTIQLKKPWAPVHMHLEYPAVEITRKWHTTYVALGSNMGDKKEYITSAIENINNSPNCIVTNRSTLIETDPVGYEDQDIFLNGVIEVKTLFSPIEYIHFLLDIEKQLDRVRIKRWGPRTIDLDVIFYDEIVTSHEEIIIPHPRMHERRFVVEPLHEIAPFYMHPVLHKRVFELFDMLT